ncbi:MAG: PLP-dependent aminotransferase family protein, partial [Armatimonadota bacterium]|nr:PLP-dependent aminotransferase family protein [Armatimonadota bacterium]MDW8155144.1 PLP-dependent aminotransferase family protein [Armatimonadota bacterium]
MELSFSIPTKPRAQDLARQLRSTILEGRLRAGTRLPSTRALAASLGCSRTLVTRAYEELAAEGFVEARRGSGTYVCADFPEVAGPQVGDFPPPRWLPPLDETPSEPVADGCRVDFSLSRQVVEPPSRRSWARMWRAVGRQSPPRDAGPVQGDPELREAVAAYLARARGLRCRAEDVVVTSGGLRALDLVAQAVLRAGDPVAVEDPGYPAARRTLGDRGAVPVPVSVDDDGLRVAELGHRALVVYVTPSH